LCLQFHFVLQYPLPGVRFLMWAAGAVLLSAPEG